MQNGEEWSCLLDYWCMCVMECMHAQSMPFPGAEFIAHEYAGHMNILWCGKKLCVRVRDYPLDDKLTNLWSGFDWEWEKLVYVLIWHNNLLLNCMAWAQ